MNRRRHIASTMGRMKLGDAAAALEGRRMDRYDRMQDQQQEEMRWRAGNQALQSLIGGVGDYQAGQAAMERQKAQDARQAALDAQGQDNWLKDFGLRENDDKRRQEDFSLKAKDRVLSRLSPALAANVRDAEGKESWSGFSEEGFEFPSPGKVALADNVALIMQEGFSEEEARVQALAAAEAVRMSRLGEKQGLEDATARRGLLTEKTKTERARQRELDARAKRAGASRAQSAGGGPQPARGPGDYSGVKNGSTRKWLASTDTLINSFEAALSIMEAEDRPDTGVLHEKVGDPVRRFVGIPEKKREMVRSKLAQGMAAWKKEMIGANQTSRELNDLQPALPRTLDEPEVMVPRMRNFIDAAKRNRDAVLAAEGIADPGSVFSGGGPQPADKVVVTDGYETLIIPRADLREAFRDGFTEVEQ
jgi:hypothetical protein